VKNGVNILLWFSIDIIELQGHPMISRGPNMECVATISNKLKELNLPVLHLISIGGWNAVHPTTDFSASEIYSCWNNWNHDISKRYCFDGFDGLDWDLEGNDSIDSKYNRFSIECLDLMGLLSQMAKQDGYIVSMAPAESYLDPTNNQFDLSLVHSYPEWNDIVPGFTYHGWNSYAYTLSKYEFTNMNGTLVPTFDYIMIQFYEGYSHFLYQTRIKQQDPSEYMYTIIKNMISGWEIAFSETVDYPNKIVSVPSSRIVIGLANAWADNSKFLFLDHVELQHIQRKLKEHQIQVRGYGFWNIQDEAREKNGKSCWLSTIIKDIMK
jgi:chitinase